MGAGVDAEVGVGVGGEWLPTWAQGWVWEWVREWVRELVREWVQEWVRLWSRATLFTAADVMGVGAK